MSIPPNLTRLPVTALALVLTIAACDTQQPTAPVTSGTRADVTPMPAQTVIVSGLHYPRGMTFDAVGNIYVAEAGTPQGNTISTVGQCEQVPAPIGPYRGGATGRISRIGKDGTRTTISDGIVSSITGTGAVTGVADVAIIGERLYALLEAGCSHGHLNDPSAIVRVRKDGSRVRVADLSAWIKAHPTANPEPDDFEPDGSWYNMIAREGTLILVEANQGNLLSASGDPLRITRIADVSATQGHVVPTTVAPIRNDYLVGELTPFPAVPGASHLLRFGRTGDVHDVASGFTAVLGVVRDAAENTYVLESFTCAGMEPCFPSPGSGRVTRLSPDGTRTVIATGLSFATSLRMGSDGALYVSNFGYGPPNQGQIIRIPLGG